MNLRFTVDIETFYLLINGCHWLQIIIVIVKTSTIFFVYWLPLVNWADQLKKGSNRIFAN